VIPSAAGNRKQNFIHFKKTNKMGTFNKEILGGFSGKTVTVMRSLPGTNRRLPVKS
jgi:hypothetical protein